MISARLLGVPQLTINGEPAPAELLWRKHLAVCLMLWQAGPRGCSRDQLVGLLWGDKDDASARHSLNEALRIIRKHAGAELLDSETEEIRWTDPALIDTTAFAAIEANDPIAAAKLVGGPFCDGFSLSEAPQFEQWLGLLRREWNERTLATLLRAVSLAEDGGSIPLSLEFASRAIEIDPWSDTAARALMRARWISGDRAGALADGRAFASRLASKLNTQPDSQTKALISRIAAGRTPRIHAEVTPAARRPPLFGRYQTLSRTLTITRNVIASKRPALIVLSGESGSGRSRLLEEIVLRASLEGEVVATMRAVDADLDDPRALWLGLASGGLLDAPGVLAAPTAVLAGVAALSPEWAERFPVTRGATGLPLSDALTGVIRTVAEESPLLLAIDDAQRLGEKGLMRIPRLLRDLVGMPVTILVNLETGTPSSAADELRRSAERDTPGSSMRIDRWELGDLDQLVGWGLPEWEESDRHRLARRLNAESDGRPAIAVELLSAVTQGLRLEGDTGSWPVPGSAQDLASQMAAPESLVAAVRLAFNRLPDPAQALLIAASLIPEPATSPTLARVAELTESRQVDAMLDRLEWERWLVADGRGYSFPTQAVRRLIGSDLVTPGQRQRFDETIATLATR